MYANSCVPVIDSRSMSSLDDQYSEKE